jgi:hypothetical protein
MSYAGAGIDDVLSSSPVGNDTQVKEHVRHSLKGCFEIRTFARLKVEDEAVRNLL